MISMKNSHMLSTKSRPVAFLPNKKILKIVAVEGEKLLLDARLLALPPKTRLQKGTDALVPTSSPIPSPSAMLGFLAHLSRQPPDPSGHTGLLC